VKHNNVGADRTGILTFDGNIRDAKKVTYKRIRLHLNFMVDIFMVQLSSCALLEIRDTNFLKDTEAWPKLQQEEQEKDSSCDTIGVVLCIEDLILLK